MVQHVNTPALKKQWVLDAQWTDCPEEIESIIKALWRNHELGNDNFMLRRTIEDFMELEAEGFSAEQWFWGATEEEKKGWVDTPVSLQPLIDYLRERGVADDDPVILHWWW